MDPKNVVLIDLSNLSLKDIFKISIRYYLSFEYLLHCIKHNTNKLWVSTNHRKNKTIIIGFSKDNEFILKSEYGKLNEKSYNKYCYMKPIEIPNIENNIFNYNLYKNYIDYGYKIDYPFTDEINYNNFKIDDLEICLN